MVFLPKTVRENVPAFTLNLREVILNLVRTIRRLIEDKEGNKNPGNYTGVFISFSLKKSLECG